MSKDMHKNLSSSDPSIYKQTRGLMSHIRTTQEEEMFGTIMSSSEGGREIQLVKERLALAKAQVKSASKRLAKAKATKKQMIETLTEDVDDAQAQLLSFQSEVKKAAASLKATEKRREAIKSSTNDKKKKRRKKDKKRKRKKDKPATEKRWEVVTTDSSSDEEEENSKKKMKVSTVEEASEDEVDAEEYNSNQVVVVMGCGSIEVDGVYKLTEGLDLLRMSCNKSVYVKQGTWNGKGGEFVLFNEVCGRWIIGFRLVGKMSWKMLYITKNKQTINTRRGEEDKSLPPKDGWMKADGANPPPKKTYAYK